MTTMRVLWVTYAALGRAAQIIEGTSSQSGTWIDATAAALFENKNIQLGVAAIASRDVKIEDAETGITFYGLNTVRRIWGQRPHASDGAYWQAVIEDFAPDCIMVWGTEFANGLSVLDAAGKVPVLFFIQGVLGRIVDYPMGLLQSSELFRYTGPIGLLKALHFKKDHAAQKRQTAFEAEMVRRSAGILTDNDWADSYYRLVAPQVQIYRCPLPINRVFLEDTYTQKERTPYTLFTIDGCNPAKGIFHLIKALAIVKECYPDTKLYIPGAISSRKPTIIFESPYFTYLKKLVKKLGLEENIEFCGRLSSEQMKEKIDSCAAFVMPSCVENHSASLREAMYAGAPCISAMVGSVDEYTQYGHDVLTYRYGEDDVLATHILRLFEDSEYARKLGKNAWYSIRANYPLDDLCAVVSDIYQDVINK